MFENSVFLIIVLIIFLLYVILKGYLMVAKYKQYNNICLCNDTCRCKIGGCKCMTGGGESMANWVNNEISPEPVYSYYSSNYSNMPKSIIGFHYTNWCGYCKRMWPIWNKVKSNLEGKVMFIENEESPGNKTPGVTSYPTIISYRNGVANKYTGGYDYEQLRTWILKAVHV